MRLNERRNRGYRTPAWITGLVVLSCYALTVDAMTAGQADALATHVVSAVGRTHGVASVPLCGDGAVALALARKSEMVVHAMSPNGANLSSTRTAFAVSGLAGTRLYAETGNASQLPYADNFVDLIVVTGLTDATMNTVSYAEVWRSLCPGGKAYVGRASVEGDGLGSSTVNAWVNGKAGAVAVTDAQGTWAVVSKSEISGTDEWTHRLHGPDNNQYSTDSVAKWPPLPQARFKPYNVGRYATTIIAGGRLFHAQTEASGWDGSIGAIRRHRFLRAYRIYNGQQLWARPLLQDWPDDLGAQEHENFPVGGSCILATGDHLYLMKHNYVLKLNAETGDSVGKVDFGSDMGTLLWIAMHNNRMYALAGDSGYRVMYGTKLRAINLSDGSTAWTHSESGKKIQHDEVVISSDGRMYFYVQGERLVCFNAATGAQIWQNIDATTIATLDNHNDFGWTDGQLAGFLCSPDGLFTCSGNDKYLVGFSPTDGHAMWQHERYGNAAVSRVLIGTDLYYSYITGRWSHMVVDVRTGNAANAGFKLGGGCGPISASANGIYGQAGSMCYRRDVERVVDMHGYKGQCDLPTQVAHGMIVTGVQSCACNTLMRGTMVESPAGGFEFDREAVGSERLEQGGAYGGVDAQVTVDGSDWATYRGGVSRSAGSSVSVPTSMGTTPRWSYIPAHPYENTDALTGSGRKKNSVVPEQEPTAPVVAGEYVFWGGTDGYVRCVNNTSGLPVWSYPTGGRIYMAPTVADGCVYVGSGDGYVYCMEAHTGRLVWRFRAAPVRRIVNTFGYLTSSWPIITGVLVDDGIAYFAAGFHALYGVHVYAVNAQTGSIVWQNNASGTYLSSGNRMGFSPAGAMTLEGNKLYIQAYTGRVGIFDKSTGAIDPKPTVAGGKIQGIRGREMGRIDATHLVRGGRLMFSDHNEKGSYLRAMTLRFTRLDAQGNPLWPEVEFQDGTALAPAWTAGSFYACAGDWDTRNDHKRLERWDMGRMMGIIDSIQANTDYSSWPGHKGLVVAAQDELGEPIPAQTWRRSDIDVLCVAATRNAVVVTTDGTHTVALLDTADGHTVWEATLPSRPLHQGVAISRSGDIIVALRDGSVLSFGESPVSVASRDEAAPQPSSPEPKLPVKADAWVARNTEPTYTYDARPGSEERETSVTPAREDASAERAGVELHEPIAVTDVASQPVSEDEAAAGLVDAPACNRESNEDVSVPLSAPAVSEHATSWTPRRPALRIADASLVSWNSESTLATTYDRDLRTWLTVRPDTDGGSVVYDLGTVQHIDAAELVWYSKRRQRCRISVEVSKDGNRYETVGEFDIHGRGTSCSFTDCKNVAGRYARLRITGRGTEEAAWQLYEIAFLGTSGDARRAAAAESE